LVTTHLNDYRELIPEFYFQPEFLANDNKFDLGNSRGRRIDDVHLPPWAHNSAIEFVYVMRKALESEHVSAHLPEWINLHFGCKQTGQAAQDAFNVYKPEMYEGIWNSKTLGNPMRRAEIEASMCHIGQLPPKIFSAPHPARNAAKIASAIASQMMVDLAIKNVTNGYIKIGEKCQVIAYGSGSLATYEVELGEGRPKVSRTATTAIEQEVQQVTSTPGQDIVALLSTGKILVVNEGTTAAGFQELASVSYLAASHEFLSIVSDEATLNLYGQKVPFVVPFYGDTILCCAVSKSFGIAVAGTISGNVVICSLFEGTKINVVNLGVGFRPIKVLITDSWGFIVTYASETIAGKISYHIFVHNVNGRFVRSVQIGFAIVAWCCFASRKGFDYVITASDVPKVSIFEVFYVNISEPLFRGKEQVVSVFYFVDKAVVMALRVDGHAVFIPLEVE
jgi:hypothetical protein